MSQGKLTAFSTLYSTETKIARAKEKGRTEYSERKRAMVNNSAANGNMLPHQNTPRKESSSGTLSAEVRNAEAIKDAIGSELDGSTWLIESTTMEVMLKAAATDEMCQEYLESCSTYQQNLADFDRASCEDDMYAPAVELIQSILDHFGLRDKRTVIDTHKTRLQHTEVQNDQGATTAPPKTGYSLVDLTVTGTPEEFDFTDPKLHPWIKKDARTYTTCLTPIDIKMKGCKDTEAQLFCQAAMYARACFNSQRHRTFVYVVMMNQEEVGLYYFDHCGGMLSKWIPYRESLDVLIRMILLTCNPERNLVGLDPTVSFVPIPSADSTPTLPAPRQYQRKICIDIGKGDMDLTVLGLTWSSNAIHGRKTICWRVKDEQGNEFMLKECSRSVCRSPTEWELLEHINKHAPDITGVGKMVGYMRSFKVSDLRKGTRMDMPENFRDRERYFILLEQHGLPIAQFQDPMQFLRAFRDAVAGHMQLWEIGILHRDISLNNVLLGKDGASDGNRGMLIDLDLGLFIETVTSHYGIDSRTGTYAFQSYMILSNKEEHKYQFPHNHLDDLESFFWVLLWTTMAYEIQRSGNRVWVHELSDMQRPGFLDNFEESMAIASGKKYEVLGPTHSLKPAVGWDPVFKTLLTDLRQFLKPKIEKKAAQRTAMNETTLDDEAEPDPNSEPPAWLRTDFPLVSLQQSDESKQDYRTFLRLVDKAILRYQTLLSDASASVTTAIPHPVTPKRSTNDRSDSISHTPGSGTKRLPEDSPEDSPGAKRIREENPFDHRGSRGGSPAPRQRKGLSARRDSQA